MIEIQVVKNIFTDIRNLFDIGVKMIQSHGLSSPSSFVLNLETLKLGERNQLQLETKKTQMEALQYLVMDNPKKTIQRHWPKLPTVLILLILQLHIHLHHHRHSRLPLKYLKADYPGYFLLEDLSVQVC